MARTNIKIPNNIFICALISSGGASTMPTLNIMTGILNNITIILPTTIFLSLSKFIELEMEDNEVKIGDPIVKVKINKKIY